MTKQMFKNIHLLKYFKLRNLELTFLKTDMQNSEPWNACIYQIYFMYKL